MRHQLLHVVHRKSHWVPQQKRLHHVGNGVCMHKRMRMCICVCLCEWMCAWMCACAYIMSATVCVCISVCVCVCVCACACVCVCVCGCVRVPSLYRQQCVYKYVYTYVYLYVFMSVCVCVWMCWFHYWEKKKSHAVPQQKAYIMWAMADILRNQPAAMYNNNFGSHFWEMLQHFSDFGEMTAKVKKRNESQVKCCKRKLLWPLGNVVNSTATASVLAPSRDFYYWCATLCALRQSTWCVCVWMCVCVCACVVRVCLCVCVCVYVHVQSYTYKTIRL